MPSMTQGEVCDENNPTLDLYTGVGNPVVLTDLAELRFRVLDITTPANKVSPVQIYPVGPSGTFQSVDPTVAAPTGVRLSLGHFFAPFTVPASEPIGDHRIEWEYRQTVIAPWETYKEDFYVAAGATAAAETYCTVQDIRDEGFTDTTKYPDSRVQMLCYLVTNYIDKMTGRWFSPRTFSLATTPTTDLPTQLALEPGDNPLRLDGSGARVQPVEIPICRLDYLGIETQAFLDASVTWIELDAIRYYNRHLSGMAHPDDRDNPQVAFTNVGKIYEAIASSLFPAPRMFPRGRMNIFLFGVFGYTDWDPIGGNPLGLTPKLINHVAKLLVIRDLLPESQANEKWTLKNRFRISSDREGSQSVSLQALWLKGAFTGDPEIDNILMSYRRQHKIAVV